MFGCHRDCPWVWNWWDALWFVRGDKIEAITATTISLNTRRGARQSLRKTDHPYDFIVPVWDVHVQVQSAVQKGLGMFKMRVAGGIASSRASPSPSRCDSVGTHDWEGLAEGIGAKKRGQGPDECG
jgi:hypothetical protein